MLMRFVVWLFLPLASVVVAQPSLEELLERDYHDDYTANVVFGYRIVTGTSKHAARYAGNALSCTHCHQNAGRKPHAMPLNIYGMYPKWRQKNGQMNTIERRIGECFAYSLDGIMPPPDAPEVQAVVAYIHFLSQGQTIGVAPEGMGVVKLPATDQDPNPAAGKVVFEEKCQLCHLPQQPDAPALAPPLWGAESFNAGAGLSRQEKLAGFIWANMPLAEPRSLSYQQAQDVAAYIRLQLRPADPRQPAGKVMKILEKLNPF